MLVGPCGVGKSHLSAAALTEMITIYGINGMWLNMRSYLDDLKNVFARGVPNDITERVIDDEILVLDDLGSARKTDFSEEMTAQIIEARHQRHMSTIFSTNLAFKEPARVSGETEGIDKFKLKSTDTRETLGDRVGYRTFSRLSEMCRVFTIEAPDYRQTRGGA
jgi:DNA replication protein DnaC